MKNTLAALASAMIAIAVDSSLAFTQQVEIAVVKKLERWVYCPANLLTETPRVEALMREAKQYGYTHFMIADAKFSRLHEMEKVYFDNVKQLQATAKSIGIEIAPAVFPVGYSNAILSVDPNLAEAMPVNDALFVVRDGVAQVLAEPLVYLPTLSERDGWGFIDDTWQLDGDALVAVDVGKANCRIMKPLRVAPFRQYHASVRIRTDRLQGRPEIKVLGADGKSLCYTNLAVAPSQDWLTYHVTFNSLNHDSINLYFGAWQPGSGRLWIADPMLEECGAVNMVRRAGTPLVVRLGDANATLLVEGRDFEPFTDPRLGVVPYTGEYEPWHASPPLRMIGNWPDGTRLRVSYYHTHVIHDGQVCGCVTEPAFTALLEREATEMTKLWETNHWMMQHDEWRMMGWDLSFARLGMTPGQVASANVDFCTKLLQDRSPQARVMVWSDMFDPHHNAVDNYYLVNGTLHQSWSGLQKEVVVVNWNFEKRVSSLSFFANRGNKQIIAGYYDAGPDQIKRWLDSVGENKIPGVVGVMYTTWQRNYNDLKAFSKAVDHYEQESLRRLR